MMGKMVKENKDNESWWMDIVILLAIIFFIGLGAFGAKLLYWDNKIDEKDREIKELNNMLAQYTVTDEQLLPCPWCKCEDVELRDTYNNEDWFVYCNNCGAKSPLFKYDEYLSTYTIEHLTREEAFEIWNSFPREEE